MNWIEYKIIIQQLNLFKFVDSENKLIYIVGGRNIFKHIKRNPTRELNELFKSIFQFYAEIINYNARHNFN